MSAQTYKSATQYRKPELDELIERLKAGEEEAAEECVHFMLSDSLGHWHNRARAKICRNLKNQPPGPTMCRRLVGVIIGRFQTGRIDEQFKDQLAIRFDPDRMRSVADQLEDHPQEYIRRYARWVRNRIDTTSMTTTANHDG